MVLCDTHSNQIFESHTFIYEMSKAQRIHFSALYSGAWVGGHLFNLSSRTPKIELSPLTLTITRVLHSQSPAHISAHSMFFSPFIQVHFFFFRIKLNLIPKLRQAHILPPSRRHIPFSQTCFLPHLSFHSSYCLHHPSELLCNKSSLDNYVCHSFSYTTSSMGGEDCLELILLVALSRAQHTV